MKTVEDWNIVSAMFGHYRLGRKDTEYNSAIFFRGHEIDELIDLLEEFKAKRNSGN